MKLGKMTAGVLSGVLVAASAGLAVVAASPAQAATGTTTASIGYSCGLINGVSAPAPYAGVQLKVTVDPASAPEGASQSIKLDLGGDGTTGAGPGLFNNGPFVGSDATTYRVVFNISIDGGAPINVASATPSAVAGVNAKVFPNGVTATISTGSLAPALTAGAHTVAVEQIIVNSANSGPAWVTGAPTNVAANAATFDSICNGGTTQQNIVGNNAPPEAPASTQSASYLDAASTDFTITPCTPTTPTGTSTALTASPASPQTVGASVTLNATVTPSACNLGSKTVAGTIQFKSGSTNLGAAQAVAAGKASVTTAALPVGGNSLTAVFTPTDDSGADGFSASTSDPLSFTMKAKAATPTPTPTETEDGPSTEAKSKSASVNAYCEVVSKATSPGNPSVTPYKGWKVTTTVSPGAAKPGEKVKVAVALNNSPKNGPATTLDAGAYRFQPSISFEGKTTSFTNGTVSGPEVPPSQSIFQSSQLPLKASGTITLPDEEGSYPVKLVNLNFNNIRGSSSPTEGESDIFDNTCNASPSPNDNPKAFSAPVVNVLADPNAESSNVDGSDEGSTDNSGVLAATGPKETLVLALLAFLALQVGAILWVRAHRSAPVRRNRAL